MTGDARLCAGCHAPLLRGARFCLNCGDPVPAEPGQPERPLPTDSIELQRVRTALSERYRIERVVGEGGMATVYLAEDLKHNRRVAVKVMRADLAISFGVERFLREVEIAAKLSHPNILPVYDSGAAEGVLYYTMPLVEGEALSLRLRREKQLPVSEAVRFAREIAEALAYAHKHGVIHRDIKPANILIHEGHALIADFGIARFSLDAGSITGSGLALGTPSYMSPEQASGEPDVDFRTDIYALGCVLYEMLAGEPPFTGPTAHAILTRSLTEKARPLAQVRESVSPAIDLIAQKALAKSRADRFDSATALAEALTLAASAESVPPPTYPPTRRHRWAILGGAMAVAGVILFGLLRQSATPRSDVEKTRSVAVLPFTNLGDSTMASFTDGLVAELRDRLARLANLTVIASVSADQYRNTEKLPTAIAHELRVGNILTGKVRWGIGGDGHRVFRITTELVDGTTGNVTWRDDFDGDVSDPLAVQGEIATQTAAALGTEFGTANSKGLTGHPTDVPEAYGRFLKGMAVPSGGVSQARESAIQYEAAVALDPQFYRAWANLTTSLSRQYSLSAPDTVLARRARQAMERTRSLGPDSMATHWAVSNYLSSVTGQQTEARDEMMKALRLAPNSPEILARMAEYDREDGNYRAMFEKLARARQFDPLNTTVLTSLTYSQLYLGQNSEALTTAKVLRALPHLDLYQLLAIVYAYLANDDLTGAQRVIGELSREFPATDLVAYFAGYQELAFVLSDEQRQLIYRLTPAAFDGDRVWWGQSLATTAWQQGDTARAAAWADSTLTEAARQIDAAPHDPQLRMLNAVALAMTGERTTALREAGLAIADTTGKTHDMILYLLQQLARVQTIAGQPREAIETLRTLLGQQSYMNGSYFKHDPSFRSLTGESRFQQLVGSTGTARK